MPLSAPRNGLFMLLTAGLAFGCDGFDGFVGYIGPRNRAAGGADAVPTSSVGSASSEAPAAGGAPAVEQPTAGGAGTCNAAAGLSLICADSAGGYCATWAARLRECGVLGPGCFAECENFSDAAEACETECIRAASCEAIVNWRCGNGSALLECFGNCIGEPPIQCGDGAVLTYPHRCNGAADCVDASDELGCPAVISMKCRNVNERVDVLLECDGKPDCSDGSDEPPACADAFVCDCDLALPAFVVCDGFPDCADGSDEPADCAAASCP